MKTDQTLDCLLGLSPQDEKIVSTFGRLSLEEDDGICWTAELPNFGAILEFRAASDHKLSLYKIFLLVTDEAVVSSTDTKNFTKFSGELPYHLKREHSVKDVIHLLGEPQLKRPEIKNDIAGFIAETVGYNLQNNKQLKVEFNENKIYRIILRQ